MVAMLLVLIIVAVVAILCSILIAVIILRCFKSQKSQATEKSSVNIQQGPQFVLPYQKYGTVQAEEVQPPSSSGTAQEFLKSPSASPADFKNDGSPEGLSQSKSFYSEFGALQPELYAQKDDVLHTSLEKEHVKPKSRRGSLHTKLKYDFRTSDFVVKLIEATDLPAMDIGGYSDPYVKIYLEPDEEKRMRQSTVQRKTLNPSFDEVYKFPITYDELQEKTLCMKVYDFDKFSRHDAIGDVKIRLCDINVSRQLDVWSDLVKPERHQEAPGDLLFSISFLPNAERLTVVALRARNLKAMDVNGSSDPFVKVSLLQGDKRVKSKKTSIQYKNCDPVWNEAISFNIPFKQIKKYSLELQVYDYDVLSQDELIGETTTGFDSDELGKTQWQEMMDFPRKQVTVWHPLKEDR
ncbi:synaptotagmin-10-like [Apostichopus japonicus]|uniref:synaptotagmin-10-like n=1 Tax=Stichopus japonicus TaxID=307972 RepID=UPI003AB6E5EB